LCVKVERTRARLCGWVPPFAVVSSSGNKYPVPHPEFIFITGRTVILAAEEGYTINFEPLRTVDLEDIPARKWSAKASSETRLH
jgi:hypothetical protein